MRFDLNIELDPVSLASRCQSQAGAGDVVLMFYEMSCICLYVTNKVCPEKRLNASWHTVYSTETLGNIIQRYTTSLNLGSVLFVPANDKHECKK